MNSIDRRLARLRVASDRQIVRDYRRMEYDDIPDDPIPVVTPPIALSFQRRLEEGERMDDLKRGFVYFVACGDFIKIGFTRNDVSRRIRSLETSNPFPITLIRSVPATPLFERTLHERFRKFHHRLEWFRREAELLEFIATFDPTGLV